MWEKVDLSGRLWLGRLFHVLFCTCTLLPWDVKTLTRFSSRRAAPASDRPSPANPENMYRKIPSDWATYIQALKSDHVTCSSGASLATRGLLRAAKLWIRVSFYLASKIMPSRKSCKAMRIVLFQKLSAQPAAYGFESAVSTICG